MVCYSCGIQNEEEAVYCKNCGVRLRQSDEAVTRLQEMTTYPQTSMDNVEQSLTNAKNVMGSAVIKKHRKLWIPVALLVVISTVAIASILLAQGGHTERSLHRQLELAERYLGELDYNQAIAAYQTAIEIDPKSVDAYLGLADAYVGIAEYKKAIEALEEGYRATDDDELTAQMAAVYLDWADEEFTLGNTEEALKILQEGYDRTGDGRLAGKRDEIEHYADEEGIADDEVVVAAEVLTDEEEADTTSYNKYEAFMRNEERVIISYEADYAEHCSFKGFMEDGGAYTLEEIINATADVGFGTVNIGEPQYRYIDCGLDGVEELDVWVVYDYPDMETFILEMVIKDIGGNLRVCYDCDSWSRSSTSISYSGFVSGEGSGGAALHFRWAGYIDAAGVWKLWYEQSEEDDYMIVHYQAFCDGEAVELDFSQIDYGGFCILDTYFEDEHYYSYGSYENGEWLSDYESDPPGIFGNVFVEYGIPTYTDKQLEEILANRRAEIGLINEIVEYDSIR